MECIGLHKHVCKQCGKQFECRVEYVYKIYKDKPKGWRWFCSYRCLQAYRRENDKINIPSGKEKAVVEMLHQGIMQKDIAEKLCITRQKVSQIKNKWIYEA